MAANRRRWSLQRHFNLTLEDYDAILQHQGGCCFICGNPPKEDGRRLAVDHDHKTGLVRGLLCWGCNAALGKFRDDPERIMRAAQYVQEPPATTALGRETYGRTGRVNAKRKRTSRKRTQTGGRKT
jgi:hypothetical protein